jgi:hypothetical protein
VKHRLEASAIAARARLSGALALLLAGAPAAAEQARAVLAVSALVAPSCAVERRPAARHTAAIACSTGASVSTMTASSHGEQPLEEAEALLGAPLRQNGDVVFTAPLHTGASSTRESAATTAGATRYLTITY